MADKFFLAALKSTETYEQDLFGKKTTFTMSTFKKVRTPADCYAICPDKLKRYDDKKKMGVANKYIELLEVCKMAQLFKSGKIRRERTKLMRSAITKIANGELVVSRSDVKKVWMDRREGLSRQRFNAASVEIRCSALLAHVSLMKRLPPFVIKMVDYKVSEDGFRTVMSAEITLEKCDETLEQWMLRRTAGGLGGKEFSKQLDGIFAQIILGLYLLQKHVGFVHNDLHTKNVMLVNRVGSGNMRVVVDGIGYVFDDSIPLVKFIDFGQSYARNPTTGEEISGMFWSPLVAQNNSWDLVRFVVTLMKRRDRDAVSLDALFSAELTSDILNVLYSVQHPTDSSANWWESSNLNVEWFSFPMHAKTPLQMITSGLVLPKFRSSDLASHHNTFGELPDDGWSYDAKPFNNREREKARESSYAPLQPCFFMADKGRHRVARALSEIREVACKAMGWRINTPFDGRKKGPVICYGGSVADASIRKRMLGKALIFYQRAVIFYLMTFARCDEEVDYGDGEHLEQMLNQPFANRASEIRAKLEPVLNIQRGMEMRYCLWASCGGYEDFFDVFDGIRRDHHFNRDSDQIAIRRDILALYNDVRWERNIRAPVEFADLRDVHGSRVSWLLDAFDWSSEMCFYSLDVKDALKVLRRSA